MSSATRIQLSVMMFLQYFIWGAWYVTMGTYLGKTLNFGGPEIGIAYTTISIAAIVSPFFVGMIADRFFATQKVLGTVHLLGGILLYFTAQLTSFWPFFITLLAYTLCYMPTIALTNSISFRQMNDPGKEFGFIRVFGTAGWIAVGLLIDVWKIQVANTTFLIAAAASIVLGIYSFFLPHTPPKNTGPVSVREVLGLDALALFRDRPFAILFGASLLVCIPLAFYYGFANPFLTDAGMQDVTSKMTLGQFSELLFMLVLPLLLTRLGVKGIIVFAMACWGLRYLLFAYGNNDSLSWMLYLGIVLHGICYDFFFVTGQIFVDRKAPAHLKSSAQGLITLATYGVGMWIGSWLAGQIVGLYTMPGADGQTQVQWTSIWLVPAVIALVVMILFAALFTEKEKESARPVSAR